MHPIAFKLGELAIHWYGVMVALGFLGGLWTASRRAMRSGISPEKVMDLGLWLIAGAIIGARALHVVSYWRDEYADQPLSEVFKIWHGGLVFYGGLIGASFACIFYCRRHQWPLWQLADVLAPSIALGYFFGRFGCLLNGCCYGRPCALPWAIRYPAGSFPAKAQQLAGLLSPGAMESLPVHPTQIYESLLNFGLYFGLAWLYRRKRFDGQVFAFYLLGYAPLRSFVEVFRGDYPAEYYHGWATPAQLVSIGIFTAGLVLLWFLPKGRKSDGGGVMRDA